MLPSPKTITTAAMTTIRITSLWELLHYRDYDDNKRGTWINHARFFNVSHPWRKFVIIFKIPFLWSFFRYNLDTHFVFNSNTSAAAMLFNMPVFTCTCRSTVVFHDKANLPQLRCTTKQTPHSWLPVTWHRLVIHTCGALLSFVLVGLSLAPFWIWLSSAPRPALLGGSGGRGLDTDARFVRVGGGASLGGGGGCLGRGDATGWNWTAGRTVLSTDNRFPFDLRTKIGKKKCKLQGTIYLQNFNGSKTPLRSK